MGGGGGPEEILDSQYGIKEKIQNVIIKGGIQMVYKHQNLCIENLYMMFVCFSDIP